MTKIHFVRDRPLAQRFRENGVPQAERIIYFLIFMMISTVFTTSTAINAMATPVNDWDKLTDLVYVGSIILGSIWLYKTNKKGDNDEFIERYICLSIPVAVQLVVIITPLSVVAMIALDLTGIMPITEESSPFTFGMIIFFMVYYYGRLHGAIKKASSQ